MFEESVSLKGVHEVNQDLTASIFHYGECLGP